MLDTYEMLAATFLLMDKENQIRFFEETFLIANVSPKVVFMMLFLILSSADINVLDQNF